MVSKKGKKENQDKENDCLWRHENNIEENRQEQIKQQNENMQDHQCFSLPRTTPFHFVPKLGIMSFYLVLLGCFLFLTDYTTKSYRQVNPKFAFSVRMPATMLGCLHSNTNIPVSFYKSSLVWYLFIRWSLTWLMERGRPLVSLSFL